MCTSCLCTGKKLATEHDPRVDPFTLVSCVCVCVCRQAGGMLGLACVMSTSS